MSMKRVLIIALTLIIILAAGLYLFFNSYWIHRYDALIAKQAGIHHVDPDLVWSVVYEETHFWPWKNGRNGEIGLMQVTPTVAQEWLSENPARNFDRAKNQDAERLLRDPEHNLEIGCWYLEKFSEEYDATPSREARMIAAYNAGKSRVNDWSRGSEGDRPLTEDEFIARIDIPSTRAYVISVLSRYRKIKTENSGTGHRLRSKPGRDTVFFSSILPKPFSSHNQ